MTEPGKFLDRVFGSPYPVRYHPVGPRHILRERIVTKVPVDKYKWQPRLVERPDVIWSEPLKRQNDGRVRAIFSYELPQRIRGGHAVRHRLQMYLDSNL